MGTWNLSAYKSRHKLSDTYSEHTRGSRSSSSRAWTGSIHAHPFSSGWIWCAAQSLTQSRPRNAAWPRCLLDASCFWCGWRLVDDRSNRCQPNKHSPPHLAFKIPFALDTAIILSSIVFQLNSNPFSRGKLCLAYEADGRCPAIVELDCLTNRKLRHDQYYDSIGLKDRTCSYKLGAEGSVAILW